MSKILLLVCLLQLALTIQFIQCSENSSPYTNLLSWGLNHNVSIQKLEMNFTSVNEKYFIAKENIHPNETLLTVPESLFINIQTIKQLLTPKFKKILEEILKLDIPLFKTEWAREQAYLALVQEISFRKKNNKLYKNFKPYFESFPDDLDNFPVFFDEEELDLLKGTNFGKTIATAKSTLLEEDKYLHTKFNFTMVDESYIRQRVLTVSRSFNISHLSTLIPFMDLFHVQIENSNAVWNYNQTQKLIEVYSTKEIKQGEAVILDTRPVPNSHCLLFYGFTQTNNTYLARHHIHTIHPRFQKDKNITMTLLKEGYDISNETFIGEMLDVYRMIASHAGFEQGDIGGYKMMLRNIEYYRHDYDYITPKDYYAKILSRRNRENIKRVIELEIALLEARMKILKDIIQSIEQKPEL